ncbi:hypothetical protein NM688_g4221 [Phlebia brevispora]|uniref:Uncharacterized protein n=1 Tax=Phlebia brevispora TaxID=194682 RepID=A0ACC1T451_9APHY|nr:hypothetical protein NM688_g4221 [Phlebia brevispora]
MSTQEMSAGDKRTRRSAANKTTQIASEQLQSSPIRSEDERGLPLFGEPSRHKVQVTKTYAGKKSKSLSPSKSSPTRRSDAKPTPSRSTPALSTPSRSRVQSASSQKWKGTKHTARGSTSTKGKSKPTDNRIPPLGPSAPVLNSTAPARDASAKAKNGRKRRLSTPSETNLSESEAESDLTPLSSPLSSPEPEVISDLSATSDHEARHTPTTPQEYVPSIRSTAREGDDDLDIWRNGDLIWIHVGTSGEVITGEEGMWWPAQVTSSSPLQVTLFGHSPGGHVLNANLVLNVPPEFSKAILSMRTRSRKMRFDERTYLHLTAVEDFVKSPRKRQKTEQAHLTERWKEARDLMLQAYEEENDGFPLLLSHYKGDSPARPLNGSAAVGTIEESEGEDGLENLWGDPGPNPMFEIPGELVLAREKPKYNQYWPAKIMRYVERTHPSDKEKYEVLYFDGIHKAIPRDMIISIYDEGFASCTMGDSEDNYGLDEGAEADRTDDLRQLPEEAISEDTLRTASPVPVLPMEAADFIALPIPEQFQYIKPVLVSLLNGLYHPANELHTDFMKGGKSRNRVVSAAWKRGDLTHQDKEELAICIRQWVRRREKREALGLVPKVEVANKPAAASDTHNGPIMNGGAENEGENVPLLASQPSSVGIEPAPSSDAEGPPPSSFVADTMVEEDASDNMSIDVYKVQKNCVIPEHTDVEDTHSSLPPSRLVPTYATLSDIDKITYCTCVLLPEAIVQILLWRNGLRKTPMLLSDQEEAALHREGEKLASATYWVHEIIFMKRSAQRKLLPQYKAGADIEYTPSGRAKRRLRE